MFRLFFNSSFSQKHPSSANPEPDVQDCASPEAHRDDKEKKKCSEQQKRKFQPGWNKFFHGCGLPIIFMADEDFEGGDAGASNTYPAQCSTLRKNGFVVMKNKPCKIVEMSTSKTGKHGHAKVHMIGIDIFTGKKYEDICPSTHNMNVPHVKRQDYQMVDIAKDGYLHMMDEAAETREDLKLPEGDIGKEITTKHANDEQFMVTVLMAMGEEKIVALKNITN